MKICTKCNIQKEFIQFRIRNKWLPENSSSRYSPWCKSCYSNYEKFAWKRDKNKRKSYKESNGRKRRLRNSQFIIQYLETHPCVDCGEVDPVVLEFDHRDTKTKKHNIGEMPCGGYSLKRIQDEINKCDVRCANCHRRKTAKQFAYYRMVRVDRFELPT